MSDCLFCGAEGSVDRVTRVFEFEYKGAKKCFDDYVVFRCAKCGEEFEEPNDNLEIEKDILNFRRKIDGFLLPSEIMRFRKAYGLTQKALADILGVGQKTFARYENGSVMQSRAMDLLLRLIMDNPDRAFEIIRNNPSVEENIVRVSFSLSLSESIPQKSITYCDADFHWETLSPCVGADTNGVRNASY